MRDATLVPHMMAAIAMMDFLFLQMAILVLFMSACAKETRDQVDEHVHAEHDQAGTTSKSYVPKNLKRERSHSIRHLFLRNDDRLRTIVKVTTALEGP